MRHVRQRRVSTNLPVNIFTPPFQIPISVRAGNISASGIFVKTLLDFDVGELLVCEFELPDAPEACSFVSQVTRTVHYTELLSKIPDEYMGLGLKFLGGARSMRGEIEKFVEVMDVGEIETELHWFN